MATNSFQQVIADLRGIDVSQASVNRCIHAVCRALAAKSAAFILFPSLAEYESLQAAFYHVAKLPGVVGAIDCTHVEIASPGGHQPEIFRNRRGYFSLNVQAVCDANMNLINLVASWSGSVHDSRIFRNSLLHATLQSRASAGKNAFLVGDSGYPCERFSENHEAMPKRPTMQRSGRRESSLSASLDVGRNNFHVLCT